MLLFNPSVLKVSLKGAERFEGNLHQPPARGPSLGHDQRDAGTGGGFQG